MTRQIFRKEALDRLASPEQLDQLMQLTSPRGWIALAGLGLLLLTAVAWGLFGTIATTVEGQGFLLRSGGVAPMAAPHAGTVTRVLAHAGEEVEKDQKLLELNPDGAVVSPYSGRVLAVDVQKGDPVQEGTTLLTLEPRKGPMEAVLYVPAAEGYQIEPGMKAEVWPASVKRGEFGALLGEVKSAAKFPAGRAEMLRRLQNEDLVNSLLSTGPVLEVIFELTPDPETFSGYRWSSSRGPHLTLYSGTSCQGTITIRTNRPIQLVFPLLRYSGGS
jgi:HlyD family secretion protein